MLFREPSYTVPVFTDGGRIKVIKVSIVTISFNQVKYLERTIQSVLNQDYPNIEYIVEDPGSTDGSRALIDQYRSRLARVILEPDSGPADGLNKGFAVATGDVFSFLNSDDVLYPTAVSAAAKFFMEHPEVDVVSGHAKVIGPDDQVLRLTYSDRMSMMRHLYNGVILIQPSTFFRRRAFERTNGFNPKNRMAWDNELFFDMAYAGCKFDLSDDIWSGYRLHSQSITTSWNHDEEKKRNQVVEGRFLRVKGRFPTRWDEALMLAHRFWRKLSNPRDTIERVLRGPILRRPLD
jgi:glycosyltransferase involved in cell wall biosynthesis